MSIPIAGQSAKLFECLLVPLFIRDSNFLEIEIQNPYLSLIR